MGRSGTVMMRTVAQNRRSRLVSRCANSTSGTRLPISGVQMRTTRNFFMAAGVSFSAQCSLLGRFGQEIMLKSEVFLPLINFFFGFFVL